MPFSPYRPASPRTALEVSPAGRTRPSPSTTEMYWGGTDPTPMTPHSSPLPTPPPDLGGAHSPFRTVHLPRESRNPLTYQTEVDATRPLYRVTGVAGHQPVSLEDCIGATTVTVEQHGHEDQLVGTGVKADQAVLFHEKETSSASDTDPVWTFTDQGGGAIAAEPPTPA
jgi:hypothetical protein